MDVLDGPGWQYSEKFLIHSGAQVRMNDSRHGWVALLCPYPARAEATNW